MQHKRSPQPEGISSAASQIQQEVAATTHTTTSTIPWCQRLIDSPRYRTVSFETRNPKSDSYEHDFFAKTLATQTTVETCIAFARKGDHRGSVPRDHDYDDVAAIFQLGTALTGHKHILHGGLAAVFLDEIMGLLLDQSSVIRKTFFTASMAIQYRKPVPIPVIVLCRALLVERSGRKVKVRSMMEDGQGTVFIEANALYIKAAAKL